MYITVGIGSRELVFSIISILVRRSVSCHGKTSVAETFPLPISDNYALLRLISILGVKYRSNPFLPPLLP